MQNTLKLIPQLELIAFCPDYEGNLIYQITDNEYQFHKRSEFVNRTNNLNKLLFEPFRKPSPGMIQKLLHGYNQDFDKNLCWMVGDRPEDEQAAQAAGVSFITLISGVRVITLVFTK